MRLQQDGPDGNCKWTAFRQSMAMRAIFFSVLLSSKYEENCVNHLTSYVIPAVLIAMLGIAAPATADDSTTGAHSKTHQQMMKECMRKHRAAKNGMSEKDMQKSCRDQIKASVDQPDKSKEPVVPAH